MRRGVWLMLFILLPTANLVHADSHPFNFYADEEIVIHPEETVSFRIAWQNIADDERHFLIETNETKSGITITDLPTNWTRVASGRLGEMEFNITADENISYGVHTISIDIKCQEDSDWLATKEIDVVVSRWSNLLFGANDGSSFYVQQNVNTSLAVNLTNYANYTDNVTITMDTDSAWEYGFIGDNNGDKALDFEIQNDSEIYVYFYIQTPPIVDGAPLAGTGPTFTLRAESGLDKRVESWTFSLEMQTFRNITIDFAEDDLILDPGDDGRIQVTLRNNGNVDIYLDTTLSFPGIENADRIEVDGWTAAIFNAFDLISLAPNESRTIEIGFDSPNVKSSELNLTLIANPLNFPQRSETVNLASRIQVNQMGEIELNTESCTSVNVGEVCQQMIKIQNNGNFYDELRLEVIDEYGMNFEIQSEYVGLSRNQQSSEIPLNLSTIDGADGYSNAEATIQLVNVDGLILDSISISSYTAPYVNWVWENSQSAVNNGRIEVLMTLRNEGNIVDGLIVKMSSSYYTEMSFIPPNNAIFEENNDKIRSFEIIDIDKGSNFTFRGWAELPDDQISSDNFFLNITANSRLADDKPFIYTSNSSFDAADKSVKSSDSIVSSVTELLSNILSIIWAWKFIIFAIILSGLIFNKAINDRNARKEKMAIRNITTQNGNNNDNWVEDFNKKKQPVPEIVQSPQIPSEAFAGMFRASSKPTELPAQPVDARLVSAASTVLDHHDIKSVKSQIDDLTNQISQGEVSQPHSANVKLPNDVVQVTDRTVPKQKSDPPPMFNLDDLDL